MRQIARSQNVAEPEREQTEIRWPGPRRVYTLVGGILFATVVGFLLTASLPFLALGIFCFLFVAISGLLPRPSILLIERGLDKSSSWVNEVVPVRRRVWLDRGFGLVVMRDVLPPEFELTGGNNLHVAWKGLGPASIEADYSVSSPKRGIHSLEPTQMAVRDPMDIQGASTIPPGASLDLTILPRIGTVRRIANVRGIGTKPLPMEDLARVGLATADFREIREYKPGDPAHSINWKASAKRIGMPGYVPVVNEYEFEGKKAIWLFCDSSTYMEVGTSVRNPFEDAVEATGALGYYYASRGYRLGAHFSSEPHQMLSIDSGRAQITRLTRRLMTLRPGGDVYDLNQAVTICRAQLLASTPHCFIVTRLDAQELQSSGIPDVYQKMNDGIKQLISFSPDARRRIRVTIVAINSHHYAPSQTTSQRLANVLAEFESRPIAAHFRRRGVSILEWNPMRETFSRLLLRQIIAEART